MSRILEVLKDEVKIGDNEGNIITVKKDCIKFKPKKNMEVEIYKNNEEFVVIKKQQKYLKAIIIILLLICPITTVPTIIYLAWKSKAIIIMLAVLLYGSFIIIKGFLG